MLAGEQPPVVIIVQLIPTPVKLLTRAYKAARLTLLNSGHNFEVLSNKLDITQILVDWKIFEHTMIWKEGLLNREDDNNTVKPVFKKKKLNFPQNSTVPNGPKTYLESVKSEIRDPKNRRQAKSNLPKEETETLREVIKL